MMIFTLSSPTSIQVEDVEIAVAGHYYCDLLSSNMQLLH
jgi:hypothetical protein